MPDDAQGARTAGRRPPPPPLRERLGALANLRPFIALIWTTSRLLTTGSILLRLGRALLPVVTLYVGKLIIDQVVYLTGLSPSPSGLSAWVESGLLDTLALLLMAELALAIVSDVLGRLVSLVEGLLSERVGNRISIELMEHAATLDLAHFEDSELQDNLERARRQTTGRIALLGQLLGQAQNLVTIASFAAGLIAYAPWLIVLLAISLVPAFFGEAYFNARGYALDRRRSPERRELDYVRQTGTSVETVKEVKIFGLSDFLIARYRRLAEAFLRDNRALANRRAAWGGLLTAVGTLGYYLAYAVIVWRTIDGSLSIGDLTFLAGSFRRLRSLLEGQLSGFSQLANQAQYLEDLFGFFEIEPAIVSSPEALSFPEPLREGFVFENVSFRYDGSERWALRDVSLALRAGEALALVGENGSGKTTLVKLLTRLYDPTEGRILLDGRDLRDYSVEDLYRNIGVIFQDFVRYHLTAGQNIAVGRIEAREDAARIRAAAEAGMADEVIARLPAGYDQPIGKRFRGGVDLSGGEWQKIAIARAYMRKAQVLVLDEPTAALDARSEYEVFQRFRELTEDKTAVLISHRFSTVRMADRIIVLAEGQVEAAGTHEELLAAGGRYAELFELQAEGYR